MAKRFTDTDLWDKEWFMKLPPRLKCLVKMVRDKADLSGVWSPNWALACQYVAEPVNLDDLLTIDRGQQFVLIPSGKVYCMGFVEFQYGNELSEKSPVHRKVINILDSHKLDYKYPINTPKEEEEEKEEEEDKDKEEEEDPPIAKEVPPKPSRQREIDFASLPMSIDDQEDRETMYQAIGSTCYELEHLSINFGDPKIRALFPWFNHLKNTGRSLGWAQVKEMIKRTDNAEVDWIDHAVTMSISNDYAGLIDFTEPKKGGNGRSNKSIQDKIMDSYGN